MSIVEDCSQSLAGKRVDIEKVPWLHGNDFLASQSGGDMRAGLQRDASRLDLGSGLVDLSFADNQRRQKTHHVVTGLHSEQMLCGKRLQERLVRNLAF